MKAMHSSTAWVGSWVRGSRGMFRHKVASARPTHARGCFVYRTECRRYVTIEEWLGPGTGGEDCRDCLALEGR